MREEQIDLVYGAVMDLGRIECDCNRVVDPSRHITREGVATWLAERKTKEVQEIARKLYMKVRKPAATKTAEELPLLSETENAAAATKPEAMGIHVPEDGNLVKAEAGPGDVKSVTFMRRCLAFQQRYGSPGGKRTMNYTKRKWEVGHYIVYAGSPIPALICNTDIGIVSEAEKTANAHLIASAPDMYETGKGLDLAIGQALLKIAQTSGLSEEWMDIVQTILLPAQEKWRQALAKAEGK